MQVTINIEAPSAIAVAESLRMIDCVRGVAAREDQITYVGPDGPVTTTVVIAQWEDTADLFGPRRDRWLPFNACYFIEF